MCFSDYFFSVLLPSVICRSNFVAVGWGWGGAQYPHLQPSSNRAVKVSLKFSLSHRVSKCIHLHLPTPPLPCPPPPTSAETASNASSLACRYPEIYHGSSGFWWHVNGRAVSGLQYSAVSMRSGFSSSFRLGIDCGLVLAGNHRPRASTAVYYLRSDPFGHCTRIAVELDCCQSASVCFFVRLLASVCMNVRVCVCMCVCK